MTVSLSSNIYVPSQVGALALAEVVACHDTKTQAISFGWHSLAKYIRPLRPGKLCIVQAYTSNGKTALLVHWARALAQNIVQRKAEKECVVYVSWEDSVEGIGIFDLANATNIPTDKVYDGLLTDDEMSQFQIAAFKRGALPLFVIGDTCGGGTKRPRMTMTHAEERLEWIRTEMGYRPIAVMLDYMNLVAPESQRSWGDNRRTDMMELTYRARELGIAGGYPVVAAAQSNRISTDRPWKCPLARDLLESSAIEQYADLILSLWLPAKTEPLDTWLKGPDGATTDIRVTRNLMIMSLCKQKTGIGSGWWALQYDPGRNIIKPMEDIGEEAIPI